MTEKCKITKTLCTLVNLLLILLLYVGIVLSSLEICLNNLCLILLAFEHLFCYYSSKEYMNNYGFKKLNHRGIIRLLVIIKNALDALAL